MLALAAFICLFPTVRFQKPPQSTWNRKFKITMFAFIQISLLCVLKIYPQILCMHGCILTPLASVWRFSAVYFQICLSNCLFVGILTLIAFSWFFSTMCIKGVFKLTFQGDEKLHWSQKFATLSTLYIFKCAFKLSGLVVAWSHLIQLWDLSIIIFVFVYNIHIRIRSFLKSRIVFVFVFGHFWKPE